MLLSGAEKEIHFKDIDDNHWAAKPVYNMVRLGVTQGYPDGTFRGLNTITRYELMAFLNNMNISLEKMIDEKIEETMFASEDKVANRAVDELRAELAALKEQFLASEASEKLPNAGKKTKIKLDMDNYIIQRSVQSSVNFQENEYYQRLKLFVEGDINKQSGYLIGLDTEYLNWGQDDLLTDDLLEGELWAKKNFNENFLLQASLSKGPGQVKMKNKKIEQRHADALTVAFDIYGIKPSVKYSVVGTTSNFDINSDGLPDSLRVVNFKPSIEYTLPLPIPYFGLWTLGYTMDQYSTEKNRYANDILRSTRYIQFNKLRISDRVSLETQHIKEVGYVPTLNVDGDNTHRQSQGFYYDAALLFDDLFNTGTIVKATYAYSGPGFGNNGLLEDWPGVNLLGYASCGYFQDDWQGENRMPSANTAEEAGLRITQDLYQNKLFLDLIYITGTAAPDPDKDEEEKDNTKYRYTMSSGGLTWKISEYFNAYAFAEQKLLYDSSIEDEDHQYSELMGILGMGLRF